MRRLYLVLTTAVGVALLVSGAAHLVYSRPAPAVEVATESPETGPDLHAALRKSRAETLWVKGSQDGLRSELNDLREELAEIRAKSEHAPTGELPTGKPEENARSEESLAGWMDDALVEHANDELTRTADQELRKLTSADGNLEISNTRCSERFCRTSITANNGELPSIASLLGNPNLASAGFMLAAGTGVMEVYFTPPGGSFESLREEAFAELGAGR